MDRPRWLGLWIPSYREIQRDSETENRGAGHPSKKLAPLVSKPVLIAKRSSVDGTPLRFVPNYKLTEAENQNSLGNFYKLPIIGLQEKDDKEGRN